MSQNSIQFALVIFIATLLVAFALFKAGKWIKNKFFGCGIAGGHLHHTACDGTAVAMADDMAAEAEPMAEPMAEYDDGMTSVSAGPMMSVSAGGSMYGGASYGGNEYMY
jgi:hypothetical protein